MLSVSEAQAAVVRETVPFEPETIPLVDAFGLTLAEKVVCDLDSPPFDKALMDGFAVRAADVADGTAELRVVEEIMAGQVPSKPVESGEAIQIMTGAPIPAGADAVVRVEDSEYDDSNAIVKIATKPVVAGTNLIERGTNTRVGDEVLPIGRTLRPQELGSLAELGRAEVLVRRQPRVAILATGDELVEVGATPGPGQIRNSNETMLVAQMRRAGVETIPLGIARDAREDLRRKVDAGLQADVLLLSGGVSAGELDLVPGVLDDAGVREIFHKVKVKPGKPIWFGRLDRGASTAGSDRCYVFGLPGNPVSSMVCCELFVRTALRRLQNIEPAEPQAIPARLAEDHETNSDRPTYYPARLETTTEGLLVRLVRWHGSSDLRATVEANGMALIPAGDVRHSSGTIVEFIEWK